jgi:hypothetical protein
VFFMGDYPYLDLYYFYINKFMQLSHYTLNLIFEYTLTLKKIHELL